jgi:hypothetical protein
MRLDEALLHVVDVEDKEGEFAIEIRFEKGEGFV